MPHELPFGFCPIHTLGTKQLGAEQLQPRTVWQSLINKAFYHMMIPEVLSSVHPQLLEREDFLRQFAAHRRGEITPRPSVQARCRSSCVRGDILYNTYCETRCVCIRKIPLPIGG